MIKVNDVCSAGIKSSHLKDNSPVDAEEVNYCREYIKEFLKVDKRGGHSSYHFKHMVESHYNTYISNGAFIVAAIQEGCRIERFSLNSPNVRVYMAHKKRYITC